MIEGKDQSYREPAWIGEGVHYEEYDIILLSCTLRVLKSIRNHEVHS